MTRHLAAEAGDSASASSMPVGPAPAITRWVSLRVLSKNGLGGEERDREQARNVGLDQPGAGGDDEAAGLDLACRRP